MASSPPTAPPPLSIVVASHASEAALESCLTSLATQLDGAELIVCEANRSSPDVRRRFPFAEFVERPGELVPHLWREGIDRSRGRTIALTISAMVPSDDWIEAINVEHQRHDAVAGAIEPGSGLRLSDWGEYFCRYAADMLPFEGHECPNLPGDNASYKSELLERTRGLYRDGFWEPVVHRQLAAEGTVLWHSPRLVVRQGRSAGARAFVRQRLQHGRAHGRQRGSRFSTTRNVAGVVGAPLVVPLMTARIFREVVVRRRLRTRALLALPAILLYNVAWAAGEARGHLEALRSSG